MVISCFLLLWKVGNTSNHGLYRQIWAWSFMFLILKHSYTPYKNFEYASTKSSSALYDCVSYILSIIFLFSKCHFIIFHRIKGRENNIWLKTRPLVHLTFLLFLSALLQTIVNQDFCLNGDIWPTQVQLEALSLIP